MSLANNDNDYESHNDSNNNNRDGDRVVNSHLSASESDVSLEQGGRTSQSMDNERVLIINNVLADSAPTNRNVATCSDSDSNVIATLEQDGVETIHNQVCQISGHDSVLTHPNSRDSVPTRSASATQAHSLPSDSLQPTNSIASTISTTNDNIGIVSTITNQNSIFPIQSITIFPNNMDRLSCNERDCYGDILELQPVAVLVTEEEEEEMDTNTMFARAVLMDDSMVQVGQRQCTTLVCIMALGWMFGLIGLIWFAKSF